MTALFISRALTACLLLAGAGRAAEPSRIVLVEKGRPASTIVVADDASPAVRSAAEELQKYLVKISGAKVPLRPASAAPTGTLILVGDGPRVRAAGVSAAQLGPEGYRIKTAGGNLVLIGADEAGVQFAVYAFLDKHLGVRWLWPGELGEVVPQRAVIAVAALDEAKAPDFKWRNRGPGGALWGTREGPTEMHARELLLGISAEHQAEVALWEKRNGWGGMKIYGGHSLGEAFPPEKYARTHPEYYALVDGKRDVPGPDYDYKHGGQICTTQPGVVQATVEWVREIFRQHPEYQAVHITMNDGGGFCECDRCRALDSGELVKRLGIEADEMKRPPTKNTVITDRIYTFVNQVAEQVEKTNPGKYVASMAYSRYSAPPRKVRLRTSVMAQYCLWSAYRHANAAWREEHEKIAAAWAGASRHAAIYEYYINGSWPGLHRLAVPQIATSLKFLHRAGIELYQTQSGDEFAINGINYYVAGKLLWDTSLDPQAILDDFYRAGFGQAAPAIRQFHARLQDAWRTATLNGEDVSCNSVEQKRLYELFTPELLKASAADLDEASRLAGDDAIRRRVEFYRQGLRYTELTVGAARAAKTALERPDRRDLAEAALAALAQRNSFVEQVKNDSVVAYFWTRYNNEQRPFWPVARLKKLAAGR